MNPRRAESSAANHWTQALDGATPERPVQVGHYEVVGLIASGGMGKVYEAIDRDHDVSVALKTLVHVDVDRVMRFKNEFRYVADVCHPNLVSLYELSCYEGLWFIAMERVDGVNFLEWVRPHPVLEPPSRTQRQSRESDRHERSWRDSDETLAERVGASLDPRADVVDGPASAPPSEQRLREAFVQLVRAVSALHAAGLLHLDLKPSNVLVDRTGRVVVLDFGLARLLEPRAHVESEEHEPINISGTPTWMPPEQFELATLDESSDWYSVGLMLYVALTGTLPFPTTSLAAIWLAKKSARLPHPRTLVPTLPADLCDLAASLIKPTREDRAEGRAALAQLTGEREAPRETGASRAFIGRAHERALLREALDSARRGAAALVHVTGGSGLGKSALLRALVDEARAQHETLVLRGRCYERETVPFKALDGVVSELAQQLERAPQDELAQRLPTRIADLARVFPSLVRVPAVARRVLSSVGASSTHSIVELRRRAGEALRQLLQLLSAKGPVVLLIDDLQWADSDSAAMLVALIDAPAPAGMLLACSFRPDEAAANRALAPYFEQVRAQTSARLIETLSLSIAPLSRDESEALAAATLARSAVSSPSLVRRVAHESGGVPFFVEQLAHFAAQRRSEGDAPPGERAELSLETVLAQRVLALDSHERALVEVLSVANSPIPLDAWFAVAGPTQRSLRALWTLKGQHFVHSTGARASDTVELRHDRMRESVYRALDRARIEQMHLGLARAFAARGASSPWLFDAVRHASIVRERLSRDERLSVAQLALAAGRAARQSAAFRLAFESFQQGLAMLGPQPFAASYELALALHSGAADAAYLCAEWSEVEQHAHAVYAHSARPEDRLQAWEAHIDSCCARERYDEAIDVALGALAMLQFELPAHPDERALGAYMQRAIDRVTALDAEGVLGLRAMTDERVAAAMRLQTRIGSATYFARPALFLLLACNSVALSTEHGLATATPYALAIFAVVLNSMGRFREAHRWGQVALALLDRGEDRALDARTRHVVHDLVCVFTVPIESTLDPLRAVVELGEEVGDPEYAAYAAHAYVHNALWASRPLAALQEEAQRFRRFMLAYKQFNALHVHAPFEQMIRCLLGQTQQPATLDGDGFDERQALSAAERAGSRSAQFLVQMLMGVARYHFGSAAEASALFEAARPFIDGVASTWHVPMFHQYAALAIYAMDEGPQRDALLSRAVESEAALLPFVEAGPDNFAHRVTLLRAERARIERRTRDALALYEQCAQDAARSRFHADVGIAHSLAARALREDDAVAHQAAIDAHTALAHRAFAEWNAAALLR